MSIKSKIILGYKNIFNVSSKKSVIETITGICPDILILILSKTSNLLFNQKSSHQIFSLFTSTATKTTYFNELQRIIFFLENNEGNEIFNEKTNSEFLKIIIENYSYLRDKKIEENYTFIEINFFRAYLILNEMTYRSKNDDKLFLDIPKEYFTEFGQIILGKKTIQYYSGSDFYFEMLKIKTLLHHYYINEKDILNRFYKNNSIENPDLWIFEIFELLMIKDSNFKVDKDQWIWKYCESMRINKFFDKKITDTDLRLNCLFFYKDEISILKWTFFLQHLFYKIYYELFQLYKSKYDEKLTFANYKSKISQIISEKILFRKVIDKAFKNKGVYVKFDDGKIDGFPDCYLRYNNSIFLFEFKDNAAGPDFLESDNYHFLKSYIDERFIKNIAQKKVKDKGITQLANSVRYLNKNIFDVDPILQKKYRQNTLDVYPIIVVTDEIFSQGAVESYLTGEFEKIKPENTEFRNIKSLILINVSSLLDYFLSSDKINYFKIIKEYSSRKKKFSPKGLFPNFPDIENISYKKSSKSISLVELIRELPISDLSIDQQFERKRPKVHLGEID